jgi:arylformamidase
MPLYDATLPIHEGMLTFPGDPQFGLRPVSKICSGDPYNLSLVSIATHTGTHIDPPAHYFENGATVDQIPLSILVGQGLILDMRGVRTIGRAELERSDLGDHRRALFKTDNGPLLRESTFTEDYTCLTPDGADYLLEKGVVLVGIDYLSIEKCDNPDAPVHKKLLGAGVLIVEGLNLVDIPAGPCKIYCLPLLLRGGDGAPARILIEAP